MQPSAGFESESLQADVMRFMAIIGFCLVAIFALVRNSDARPVVAPPPDARPRVANPEPVPVSNAAVAQPPVAAFEPRPPAPTPATERLPAPATVPVAVPARPMPAIPAPAAPESPADAPEPSEVASVNPSPAAGATEPGLSLSFRSDRDFLRLVSTGVIELFVMNDTAAAEPTLRFDPHGQFAPARAPGRIYELLPGTIPRTITTALAQRPARSGSSDASGVLTWGVTLPPALERELAQQRERHSQGTLLIDRYARIRHVPPA